MAAQTFEKQPDELFSPYSFYELTKAVAAAKRPDEIYQAALACLRDSLGVQKSSVLLFDPDRVIRFKAWLNLSGEYRTLVEGHTPWTPETKDAEPVLVADVREDASLAALRPAIEAEGIRALAFVPLVIGERLLGKFMLYYAEPHAFTQHEIIVAQTIAAQVSFAIDHQEKLSQRVHLDAMFRSQVTGIVQADRQARILVVNDRFCEIVGRTREELIGAPTDAFTHPDDVDRTHANVRALTEGADYFTIEKRYLHPDGKQVWISASVTSMKDEKDDPSGLIAVVTDITERKLAEEAAQEMSRRYRNLVQALGLAVYTTDAEGRITSYNEAAATLWGRRPELHKDLWCGSWRIFNAEDQTEMSLDQCPMAVALKERRPVRDVEIIVERPDGSRANILPYPTPLFETDGSLVGAVNVLVDITERKRAEVALAERNQLIESMTDNMSVGLITVSKTGTIELMNPAAERITGLRQEDAQGKSLHQALHHTHPDGTPYPSSECPMVEASRQRRSMTAHEDVFVRPDGSFYDVVCNLAPLVSDGLGLGAILDMRDVTADKQAEKVLRDSEEAMRTAAALKDQFLGLISHELRTPISTIYGNGLLLLRRGEALQSEDRQQALSDIVSEASKLQEIIENLLLLTRLEGGQLQLDPLVLPHVVSESINEFKRMHPARQVSYEADEAVPIALGQQTLVELVVRNLLSNAAKYSPADSPIDVRLYLNENRLPEVSVRDHGIGLSELDKSNVFTAFYRSEEARGQAPGMGLGLAVCQRVIEAQNGGIFVRSMPGEGAEFRFYLQAVAD